MTKDGTKKETAMNKIVKIGVPKTIDRASTNQSPEALHKEAKATIHGKAGKAGHHPETVGHRMTEADHLHLRKKSRKQTTSIDTKENATVPLIGMEVQVLTKAGPMWRA